MGKLIKSEAVQLNEKAIEKTKLNLRDLKDSAPCSNCYNDNFEAEEVPYLDMNLVVNMITNYQSNQYQAITNPSSISPIPDDARSVYFSLQRLKSFIFEMEKECCPCNTELGELGIRFYFAAYPEATKFPNYPELTNVDPAYSKLHTLVLVPTYTPQTNNPNNEHIDFIPGQTIDDGYCTPKSLEEDAMNAYTQIGSGVNTNAKTQQTLAKKNSNTPTIKALVGGFNENRKIVNKSTTIAKKKNAIVGKKPNPNQGNEQSGISNHGDLIPPPNKKPSIRYTDAVLLNC